MTKLTGYCSKGRCCKWSFGFVGLVFLVTGCVLIEVFDTLIHDKVDENLPLKNGTDSYKNWLSPPAPIYFQIWVQHISNHDEVINLGAKPVLVEKGPYTYREKREKVNVTYGANGTISYEENKWFYFDRDMSVGPETDNFTTANLPMITIANMVKFEYGFIQALVNAILDSTNEHLFIELSVGDLMWGYEDPLLKEIKKYLPVDDKFGLFYNKNGSNDGVYKINAGLAGSVDHFAEIVTWNGNKSLSFWNGTSANSINGSDGTLYPPFIDSSKSYYLFSSDLCRSLEIVYNEKYALKGIDLWRFVTSARTLANVTVNPDNIGFCTPESNCLPAGLLNASVCREGAPIIFSLPHFLDGDPDIQRRVVGMTPNRLEHQSVIDIEPMTGVVMNAAKRLQINAYLNKLPHIKDTENLHEYIILPVLWLNESATLDDKSASDFRDEVLTPMKIMDYIKYGLIGLGALILVCIICAVIKNLLFRTDMEMKVMGGGDKERGDKEPILT